ncbi:hypothetical protein [Pelomicrobium sp. G1]|uniref:hypothetical protein n=1 Tax=unclassified Pelomicrobium TaxID=2815318 RepID=UPI003F775528
MSQLRVQLSSRTGKSFAGHRVVASFAQLVTIDAESAPREVPGEASKAVEDSGLALIELPGKDTLSRDQKITLSVMAPDGQVLAREATTVDAVNREEPVSIRVEPKEFFPVEPNTDLAFVKPARIRGFLVDPSGRNRVGNRQVVLWARRMGAGPEEPMEIVGVARSDSRGYFSAPFPLGRFSAAAGTVSDSQPIPVRLNEDGTFPDRIVLGVELPEAAAGDGERADAAEVPRNPDPEDLVNSSTFSTDAGHCVDITRPNRVLEEFDFYTVVRTTEPTIRGLTVKEPPKIGLNDILRILDPKILQFALRVEPQALLSTTGPAAGAAERQPRFIAGFPNPSGLREESAMSARIFAEVRPELEHLSEVLGLSALRMARARPAADSGAAAALPAEEIRIEADVAKTLIRDPDGFSLMRLAQAELVTRKNDLVRLLDVLRRFQPARGELHCANPVDWDDEPTFYQACTVAHGHILHFKQEWVADGYSLGDLLYSLPLAPCQKKQIAVIDWDRRETAARRESLEEQEFLSAQLSRDRDISEMANAMVRESLSGGSEASASSFGGGLGIGAIIGPVGGLLGIGGGTSGASSSAWQNASRTTAASSLQQLRDRVSQAATAVRSQRSTVIQTVRQGETMRVQTEVVANHNHCHAITIEYFEVLRHFLVRNKLVDVQECLLVPLLMSRFDSAKARRWREPLSRYLRDRRLARGFDALQRIADNYVGSDMPVGSYAEEDLIYLDGWLRIQFRIQRPRDNNDGSFLEASWQPLAWLGITPQEWWKSYLEGQQQRDRIFAEVLGPRIAEEISNGLRLYAIDHDDHQTLLPIDATLVSDFRNDQPLYVSLRLNASLPPLRRDRIKFIKVDTTVDTKAGPRNIDTLLPTGSKVIVHSGQMGYRTRHIAHDLFNQSRILNDLSGTDGVLIFCPLARPELRRPREEDKEYANSLLKHLNDHLEYYHRAIWWSVDPQRRYMLLDGFIAPNSGGRSVASVVENRLIGIIGNCLVMPVARGFHLDPTFKQDVDNPIDLLGHYQPATPIPPLRIAVPTKGVFAESVMGACNSCEKKDESRFWRWEESPCPGEPTPIQPVSTETRRAVPPDLTAKEFPAPIVAFQNVPAAPEPQGFGTLLQLLSNPNLFRDVTGLTENQRNALAALQAALGTAQFFGGKAADLALQANMNKDIDKALDKINEQHAAGAINDQQRAQLTEAALRSMIGGGTQTPAEPMTTGQVESLTNTAGANQAAVRVQRPGGDTVDIDARPEPAAEDRPARPVIILPPAINSPDARAFFPSRQDKSGVTTLRAEVRNAPAGATFRWSRPDPTTLTIDAPNSAQTLVRGVKPGLTELDFIVHESGGSPLASVKMRLSVPQFVTVNDEAAAFYAVLTGWSLLHVKSEILREAKAVCDHLLRTCNVRTIWLMAPFSETLPGHIPAAHVTALTIRGESPPGTLLYGRTNPGAAGNGGASVFNETIDIFPGAFDESGPSGPFAIEVDTETQALAIELASRTASDPALTQFAIKVFGRLIGETMAHEIVHSLLWADIHPTFHNDPPIPNDLMNAGSERSFRQRTGLEDTAHTSPVDPANFIDHGIAAIGGLQAANQGLVDARFPVPPSFT